MYLIFRTTRERAVCQVRTARKVSVCPALCKLFPFSAAVECSLKRVGRAFGLQRKRVLSFTRQAVRLAAGRGRANGVNYFIRKAHGRHTEEFRQRSAASGMGGSFAWGA